MEFLYHVILPESHEHYVSIKNVLSEGIHFFTKSNNWYGNGGHCKIELTKKLASGKIPLWADFTKAIGVEITPKDLGYFKFPVFTDKILAFNKEYSESIFDQAFYEDNKYTFEEALDFDTGESIEYWISQYLNSLLPLEEYLNLKPYPTAEILLFESVPKDIIQIYR